MSASAAQPTGTHPLLGEAQSLLPDIIGVRRALHRMPELGLSLPHTQRTVLEALSGLPLNVTTGGRLSSVTATLEGAHPGRTILLRADMDALPLAEDTGLEYASQVPGVMHACGHDLHTAMLIGAARLLCARSTGFSGRVVFMFQPAEESGGGAPCMIEEGVLDAPDGQGVDAAFALHVMTRFATGTVHLRPGPMFAASDLIHITVRGRGGHASAPHLALDPVPVACEIVQALHTAVTRTISVFDPAVLTITRIQAGTATNIIPETAELYGTCRTLTPATRQRMRTLIEQVARHVAAAHSTEADIDPAPGYPPVLNDPAFTTTVRDTATELLGADPVHHLADPVMGSEDFSYVLERVPGAMALLGARPPATATDAAPDCHSNRVVFDENAMATGMALHTAVALRHLAG
ncbi:M20 family metallopeptidase [Streptomyces sp. RerS4]|uniref:M20 metallopeptidase family protein n=1 Tax=Streptomyces sp. RerS4 TaxID=2942449 RepID=UPI00201C8DA7|nr:M20 family metallopeptidase [Streptomyces sp. RerS4]UQX04629.1 M20 family metallopeptidase [Streptomyces sp. RerS4]